MKLHIQPQTHALVFNLNALLEFGIYTPNQSKSIFTYGS